MTTGRFPRCILVTVAVILALGRLGAEERPRPINVVLVLADDMGAHSLSSLGGEVPTPNLDRLAAEGVSFTNFHVAPMCAPTRDMLLTGQYRLRFKGRPGPEIPWVSNHLDRLGYATGIAGKWFAGSRFDPPARYDEACVFVNGYRFWSPDIMVWGSQGLFSELNQPPVEDKLNEWKIPLPGSKGAADERHLATRLDGRFADDVMVDFLEDFISRHREKPFFAFYSTKLVHIPHQPSPDGDPAKIAVYQEVSVEHDKDVNKAAHAVFDERGIEYGWQDWKNDRKDGIAYLDKKVGQLVEHLRQEGILDHTLILFTSDNGNANKDHVRKGVTTLPGGKGGSLEGGTRVPLIAYCPARFGGGREVDDLLHAVDLLPTLVDLAGGERPDDERLDGISFAPQLRGDPDATGHDYLLGTSAHPNVYMEKARKDFGNPEHQQDGIMWIRGQRYKLYRDGRFYDLSEDLAEEHWIKPGAGDPEDEAARERLGQHLARYVALVHSSSSADDEADDSGDHE